MPEVAFHFNVGQNAAAKLSYACRLLRKAVAAGARIWVVGESAVIAQLDRLLWSFAPLEFVPHCVVGAAGVTDHMVNLSPVVLSESEQGCTQPDVLLNLSDAMPAALESFRRVIEIVSLDETDRLDARKRWKQYSALGCNITRHDIAPQGGRD